MLRLGIPPTDGNTTPHEPFGSSAYTTSSTDDTALTAPPPSDPDAARPDRSRACHCFVTSTTGALGREQPEPSIWAAFRRPSHRTGGAVCAMSTPASRGERESERVDLAGTGAAQQPGYDGERPAGVGEVVDEEHRLPCQLRGERGRHLVGIPHLAQA